MPARAPKPNLKSTHSPHYTHFTGLAMLCVANGAPVDELGKLFTYVAVVVLI